MMQENDWFHELYTTFSKHLVRLGLRSSIELEISKELMQQTFFLLLVKYEQIKAANRNIPGWLIKTNHNLIKQELSSARRRYEVSMAEWFDASCEDTYHFPLRDMLPAGLTERHQTILIFRYEEQLSYREIAQQMDISEGYVGVLLGRALQEFRKLYLSEQARFAKGISFPT